jgi:hypothetical protein
MPGFWAGKRIADNTGLRRTTEMRTVHPSNLWLDYTPMLTRRGPAADSRKDEDLVLCSGGRFAERVLRRAGDKSSGKTA